MGKKEDVCKKCKHRLVLANLASSYGELEAWPDQEPYKSGVVEPVFVGGQESKALGISSRIGLHVCPKCGAVNDIWVEEL